MQYQTEHIQELAQSQQLLSQLLIFVGEHYQEQSATLVEDPTHFFRLWANQDPNQTIKVFTAREQGEIKGCVMVQLVKNPLFIAKPTAIKFVEITNGDKAFEDYVQIILESL